MAMNTKKIEMKCFDIDPATGQGLVKYAGKIASVPGFLPGEEGLVEVAETQNKSKFRLIKLFKASKVRVDEKCGIYDKCGGCHLLHMNYLEQISLKKKHVINCLKKEKVDSKIDEVLMADRKDGYRNKMIVGYKQKDRDIIYGFYEEESHRIIPMKNCLVQSERQNEVAKAISLIMRDMKIAPYDEDKRKGVIRYALIREAVTTKELLVTLVTYSDIFPGRNDFIKRLRNKCPYITTIIQNVNSRKTSVVLGEKETVLYGPGFIVDELLGIKFKISSKTFYQINHDQTEKLYNKVIEYANLTGNEIVIDAYCGVGTIGMTMSKKAKEVYGVEVNKQSVINAKSNAVDNKIKNIKFICEDATDYLHKLAEMHTKIDVLVMDPPRSGSTEKFLNAIGKLNPKRVVYVSCDPQTLARDLGYFLRNNKNYKVTKKCICDMFVGTYHIETICLLEKNTIK